MKPIIRGNDSTRKPNRVLACVLIGAGFLFGVFNGVSQTAPVLTVAPMGTNQLLITITNGPVGNYELWTTPVLGDTVDYPWTAAAVGTNGQTVFILAMPPYQTGFYQALLDTNGIPLWEAADPHNQAAGVLNVWIDSPANGTTLN